MRYKKFVFGESLREIVESLPGKNRQYRFLMAIMGYGVDGIEPEFRGIEASVWIGVRTVIDNTRLKKGGQPGNSNAAKDRDSEPGSGEDASADGAGTPEDGPEPEQEDGPESIRFFVETNKNEWDNANTNTNTNANTNTNTKGKGEPGESPGPPGAGAPVSPGRSRFSKPAVDKVREYCEERQNRVDPEAFVNFYESKGWRIGREPMKDWKAAVRTWEKRSGDRASGPPRAEEPEYDLLELASGVTF